MSAEKKVAVGKKSSGGALARLSRNAGATSLKDAPVVQVPLEKVIFDPKQPRQAFHAFDGIISQTDQEALTDLAASIKVHGLIHPITVSEQADGRYLVRVGERRTRACMLNGDATIAARVRNDLDGMLALALQMAENTDRSDLKDREIADTISRLLTKSEENPHPMTKAQVAQALGKTAGWVTRFVAFGNEILRQKWVIPGYVESPEILYLVSNLPENIQESLYAAMSNGTVSAPLRSGALEYYQNMARRQKAGIAPEEETKPVVPAEPVQESEPGNDVQNDSAPPDETPSEKEAGDEAARSIVIDAALNDSEPVVTTNNQVGEYQMPAELVKDLRVPTFVGGDEGEGGTILGSTPRTISASAVPCRMPLMVLRGLVEKYGESLEISKLDAEVRFPSGMAVNLVRELTGEDVEEDRVAMKLALALKKLGEL